MKRWPAITSFILFITLCVSIAYWTMLFIQPKPRSIRAAPLPAQITPDLSVAATLLGGVVQAKVSNNFRLTGIIVSNPLAESLAIIAADGKPARPFHLQAEIQPGIRIHEMQRSYVLLEQNGEITRLELLPANK
ncbi:MAG: type II secretion system protein N [Sideroxydans sp.]|jgi:general secretion pathway protein C